eukprot:COSAG06_NODE_4888_length_3880_cov_3.336683_6_plen_59_part_01
MGTEAAAYQVPAMQAFIHEWRDRTRAIVSIMHARAPGSLISHCCMLQLGAQRAHVSGLG